MNVEKYIEGHCSKRSKQRIADSLGINGQTLADEDSAKAYEKQLDRINESIRKCADRKAKRAAMKGEPTT